MRFSNFQFSIFKLSIFIIVILMGGCQRVQTSNSNTSPVVIQNGRKYREITVADKKLRVEIADTEAKTLEGLSDRDEIGSDGMLFVFPYQQEVAFWMKGMKFGLDFVWIGRDATGKYKIVDLTPKIPAPENPKNLQSLPTYQPKKPVVMVLEVPFGWVEKNGVKVGDEMRLE
jgi:uncharacterized membrane protein (UPF0127 family)